MATHATVWTGILSSGTLTAGYAVVKNGSVFLPATSANRALYGRARGVAISSSDANNPAFEYQVAGVLSADLSGLPDGDIDDAVIVDANGQLERTASPSGSDDIIGVCPSTSGDVQITPCRSADGGGAGTPGGADTQVQYNDGGSFGGDAGMTYNETTNVLTVGGLTLGTPLTVPNGGTGAATHTSGNILIGAGASAITSFTPGSGFVTWATTPSSANLRSLVTDETGTGVLVFGTAPTFTTSITVNTGTAPATTGAVNLSRDGVIAIRNQGDTADILALFKGSDDRIDVGDGSGNVRLVAGTGHIAYALADTHRLMSGTAAAEYAKFTSSGMVLLNGPTLSASGTNFRFSDSSGGQFLTLAIPDLAADRTLNVPLMTGTDTVALVDFAQTLTNKTIAAGSNTISGITDTNIDAAANIALSKTALSANARTFLATPSSANLATLMSDETGSAGNLVFSSNPTISSPTLQNTTTISNGRVVCASATPGALAFDWSSANTFTKTLSAGGNTITFSNDTDGQTIIVVLTSNGGGSTVTWPSGVKWTGGTEPTQTSTGIDIYTLTKAGGTVYGSYVQNFS